MKTRSLIFATCCFAVMLYFSLRAENPYPMVCNLVADKIYLPQKKISEWKRICLHRAQLVQPWSSHDLIIKDLNNTLQLLQVSHLEVYEPQSAARLWTGANQETGIESEFVDSELVIFKIHPGSVADKSGLKYGDVILSLNDEQPNPWQLQSVGGRILYRRGEVEKSVMLKADSLQRDEKISVQKVGRDRWQIVIPSFRKEFFVINPLLPYKKELSSAHQIIVDLRGNQGGNFVAGLRFLANFLCEPQEIGRLYKPREGRKKISTIPNDLDDLKQLRALDGASSMVLKTAPAELCLRAPVLVLVDAKTSSVAEMVAQAFKENIRATVWGNGTSGQLLVGVWYPLDELGRGVQISIPEAVYKSRQGLEIEGHGVSVDRNLYYDLKEMQRGLDSWIEKATARVVK